MPPYTVNQGDCLSSIASQNGFTWEKIWNHSNNSALKRMRKDPNVLLPGDVVFIPDKDDHNVPCATEKRHRFVRKGVPAFLRLVLADYESKPRANVQYVLVIDGNRISGTTGNDGKIEHRIPPNAQKGELRIGADGREIYNLHLGHTDPISEISGVRCRLKNLGFDCGAMDGALNPETRIALQEFQRRYGLPDTGEPDEATRNKLKEVHGS